MPGEILAAAAQEVLGRPLQMTPEQLSALANPEAVVQTRTGTGGAGAEAVEAMLEECSQEARKYQKFCSQERQRVADGEARLLAEARQRTGDESPPVQ